MFAGAEGRRHTCWPSLMSQPDRSISSFRMPFHAPFAISFWRAAGTPCTRRVTHPKLNKQASEVKRRVGINAQATRMTTTLPSETKFINGNTATVQDVPFQKHLGIAQPPQNRVSTFDDKVRTNDKVFRCEHGRRTDWLVYCCQTVAYSSFDIAMSMP